MFLNAKKCRRSLFIYSVPFITAMVLAVTMGGSGTAPAFSAAYGANVLRKSPIPGLLELWFSSGNCGRGKGTATTIESLLDPDYMSFAVVSIILFSVAVALLIANIAGIPQSTSQATVLAVTAVAFVF